MTDNYFNCIYKIVNKINGHFYVGKARDFQKRLKSHKCNVFNPKTSEYNTYFGRSVRKYGWSDFEWSVLYENVDIDQLDVAEMCAIYTFEPKYNMTLGGEGFRGNHTAETRQKISLANKGKCLTEETKKKISDAKCGDKNFMFGKHHSKEAAQKISKAHKGKHFSEETKRKMSLAQQNRSEETKLKMSKNHVGMRGKIHADSTKNKMSISHANASKETRLSISIGNGGKSFKVYKQDTNEYVGTWINQNECARILVCSASNICSCLGGKHKSHKGYIFKYE